MISFSEVITNINYYNISGGGEFAPQIQNGFINVVPDSPLEGKTVRLECFAYGT